MKTVYVASYKGKGKLFNKLLRWLDISPYSHTELALQLNPDGTWLCCSSSMMDGGVRFKAIDIHSGNWDLIEFQVSDEQYSAMLDFCAKKVLQQVKYDCLGMLGAGFIGLRQNKKKEFCNEFVGNAMALMFDIREPFRLRPASFHNQMLAIQSAKAGGRE